MVITSLLTVVWRKDKETKGQWWKVSAEIYNVYEVSTRLNGMHKMHNPCSFKQTNVTQTMDLISRSNTNWTTPLVWTFTSRQFTISFTITVITANNGFHIDNMLVWLLQHLDYNYCTTIIGKKNIFDKTESEPLINIKGSTGL